MIKIVVIDEREKDRAEITSLLSACIDIEITAYGKDGYDALKYAERLKPDIAIVDLREDFIDGPGIIPLIRRKSPCTSVILFTPKNDEHFLCDALRGGAAGYLIKSKDHDILIRAIRVVYNGGYFFSPQVCAMRMKIAAELIKLQNKKTGAFIKKSLECEIPPCINRTELRIIGYIGRGHTDNEIATKLNLSPGTIRNNISSALHKTGLHNRAQMALFAVQSGIVNL
jgi:DNA-binding NarL/FixJ family response regulator